MKQITLLRRYKPEATLGNLIVDGKRLCSTLERPNLNNQKDNPATEENESSCIPEGIYICKKYSSRRFPDTWEITGVKGRDSVLFHCANYAFQLKGCIATAETIQDMNPKNDPNFEAVRRWYASQSKDAFEKFKKAMAKEFELKIISEETLCKA